MELWALGVAGGGLLALDILALWCGHDSREVMGGDEPLRREEWWHEADLRRGRFVAALTWLARLAPVVRASAAQHAPSARPAAGAAPRTGVRRCGRPAVAAA